MKAILTRTWTGGQRNCFKNCIEHSSSMKIVLDISRKKIPRGNNTPNKKIHINMYNEEENV